MVKRPTAKRPPSVFSNLKRLPIPPLRGVLYVTGGARGKEVVLLGDPQGLRSLARVLEALADIDQTKINMPSTAKTHLHLDPGIQMDPGSSRLILSRADLPSGELDAPCLDRMPSKVRPIREVCRYRKA